jgi:hypothetical protein
LRHTPYTFNDPDGQQEINVVNQLAPPVDAAHPPQPDPKPVQVVRENPIPDSTQQTNDRYHNHARIKDTVWKNYDLVATQWPTAPQDRGNGKPFPEGKVANVTIETHVQTSSCMTCHGFPNPKSADFVWMLYLRAYPSPEERRR